jgi:acetyl esterase/lipase
MHTNNLITLLVVAALIPAGAARSQQQNAGLQDPPWLKEQLPKHVVYAVPGMDRVKSRTNLTYKRVGDTELKADVYSPPDSAAGSIHSAVILIHGGYLPRNLLTQPKDWGVYTSYGQLLAASGFVAVTFNHRFYGWDTLQDSQSDVTDLVAYVRDHAASFGIDKNRICLWAFSGGGPFLSQAMRETPAYVLCIVSYYALLDLQPLRKTIPPSVTDEVLARFSPLHYMGVNGAKIAPILIARAGLDSPVLNGGVDRFVQEALSKNASLDLCTHPTGHHGFDILDDNDRSREIIKRTIEFIRTHCESGQKR